MDASNLDILAQPVFVWSIAPAFVALVAPAPRGSPCRIRSIAAIVTAP